jgi:large subunit ribosomal protein L15
MAPTKKSTAKAEQPETYFTLGDLRPAKGATKNRLRVGRGRASGAGKTCNRGHNGEGQRSGLSKKRGFEGGQMPLYRRLPHIDGFILVNQRKWLELNIKDLTDFLFPEESDLTYQKLEALGIFNPNRYDGIRILGNGELKRKVNVEAHHVTPSAREKIEALGGKVTLIVPQAKTES